MRLEADDGLVTGYIEYVQESAVGMFVDVFSRGEQHYPPSHQSQWALALV